MNTRQKDVINISAEDIRSMDFDKIESQLMSAKISIK